MKFTDFLKKTKDFSLNILFPEKIKCIFCGCDIDNFEKRPYCDECAKQDFFNTGNRCMVCDVKIKEHNIICDFCGHKKKKFEKAFCPLLYKDLAKNSLLRLKSDNARYLAYPFAKLLYERIREANLDIDIIIPIPMHEKSRKRRGYNQAELLGNELAKLMDCECRNNVVVKETQTKDQKTLTYRERLKNVSNCFKLKDKESIKNKNVLIIDDIMTTGSTINEVAVTMMPYATHIFAAAVARDMVE